MRLKVLYLVVLVSGCVMGAGFVSGSELWMFFGKYGLYALPLILLFVIIFTSGIYKVMTLKQKYNINNLTELSMIISPRFGKYVDYVLKVSYIIFASAMLAGIRVVGGEITVWVTLLISVLVVILNKKTLRYFYRDILANSKYPIQVKISNIPRRSLDEDFERN